MKQVLIMAAASIVLFLVGVFPATAQAGGQKAQLYYIHDVVVDPAKTGECEAYLKDLTARLKENACSFEIKVYSTMDFHYYAFIPIQNYADIDSNKKQLADIYRNMGADNFRALLARRNAFIQHHNYFVIRYLPELSYIPVNSRYKTEEELFRHWIFCYPKPDREQELRTALSQFLGLYKKTNYPFTEIVYQVELGSDLPLYIGEERGRNIFEFWPSIKEAGTILGDEGGKILWAEPLRKIERRDGTYRPELSYLPEK